MPNRVRSDGSRSSGIDHDTAQFAAQAVYRWWKKMAECEQ
jgi:hypothetical protein